MRLFQLVAWALLATAARGESISQVGVGVDAACTALFDGYRIIPGAYEGHLGEYVPGPNFLIQVLNTATPCQVIAEEPGEPLRLLWQLSLTATGEIPPDFVLLVDGILPYNYSLVTSLEIQTIQLVTGHDQELYGPIPWILQGTVRYQMRPSTPFTSFDVETHGTGVGDFSIDSTFYCPDSSCLLGGRFQSTIPEPAGLWLLLAGLLWLRLSKTIKNY